MNALAYIIGTMKQGYNVEPNQIGFIPEPRVEHYYMARNFYVLQTNRTGVNVGYILHGKPVAGGVLTIAQALIDADRRNRGFGEMSVATVIERARAANCREIKLRCAADLEANLFWSAMGFELTKTEFPGNKRRRAINTYVLILWPRLF